MSAAIPLGVRSESPCIASAHPIKELGHVLAIRNPRDERFTLWTRVHKRDDSTP